MPGCIIRRCESRPDSIGLDEDKLRVDATILDARFKQSDQSPLWAEQLVPIEFKRHGSANDPFDDDAREDDIIAKADSRTKVRTQLAHYAELLFGVQQRCFVLMILIIGPQYRILRWDRVGVAVTPLKNYFTEWVEFIGILSRIALAHASDPISLGFDPTAIRLHPNNPEWSYMSDAAEPCETDIVVDGGELPLLKEPYTFDYVRQAFRESLVADYPRYKIRVPHADGQRFFLICKPAYQMKDLFGRGTRGHVAIEYLTNRRPEEPFSFVFLKDTWRNADSRETEGNVVQRLDQLQVPNVPTLVCHGDASLPQGVQQTMTQEYWKALSSRSRSSKRKGSERRVSNALGPDPLPKRIHYRYIVKEVGRPLHDCGCPCNLIEAIADSIEGTHPPTLRRRGSRANLPDVST